MDRPQLGDRQAALLSVECAGPESSGLRLFGQSHKQAWLGSWLLLGEPEELCAGSVAADPACVGGGAGARFLWDPEWWL